MKTTLELLHEQIAEACSATKPRTRDRMKALAAIKWRLESFEGLCAGLDDKFGCALVLPHNAVVFDGRDNEEMKKKFYETILGVELAIVLMD
jgi:hypothetical protein